MFDKLSQGSFGRISANPLAKCFPPPQRDVSFKETSNQHKGSDWYPHLASGLDNTVLGATYGKLVA